MDIRLIIRLHEFFLMGKTGTPKELGLKLCVSERTVFNYISYMRTELNAPIIFNIQKGSYCYSRECDLSFNG
jgi:hypothetical protein